MRLLLICLGGALGTGARYLLGGVVARWLGAEFPWGTLVVNVTGAVAIGLVQEIGLTTLAIPDTVRVVLALGLLGGFTTYSSFSYETLRLVEGGAWAAAVLNVLTTTVLCLAGCSLGIGAARLLVGARGGL